MAKDLTMTNLKCNAMHNKYIHIQKNILIIDKDIQHKLLSIYQEINEIMHTHQHAVRCMEVDQSNVIILLVNPNAKNK